MRLATGNLAVFSPVALTDTVKQEIASLGGKMGYIVALDQEHHIFLESYHKVRDAGFSYGLWPSGRLPIC